MFLTEISKLILTILLQNSLRSKFCRQKNEWYAIPRMGAATNKIEIAVTIVSVMRSEISHLHDIVTDTPENRTVRNIKN